MGILKNASVKLYLAIKKSLNNERGAQTLEWVALAAVVVTIAFLLSQAIKSESISGVTDKIFDKIKEGIGG